MSDAVFLETISLSGHEGDLIEAYSARPIGDGKVAGVVVIHHMPGYDEATKQITYRFAVHGYNAVMPNLYSREAPGASPDDAAARARITGGVPDERLVGDIAGATGYLKGLTTSNGKVAVIGYCSGGRQAFLAACSLTLDAAVDCYGAFVVGEPPGNIPIRATPLLHLAGNLSCPLLGLFGAEDSHPSPDEVALLEAELTRLGKQHEFHLFERAGHGFFAVDRPSYRVEAASEGWRAIWAFFESHLVE